MRVSAGKFVTNARTDVLVNASTINAGGGLQRTVSFLEALLNDPARRAWRAVVSPVVARELGAIVEQQRERVIVVKRSPARSPTIRRWLRRLEIELSPTCILSIGAPAYVKFRARHLLFCTNPWITHPSRIAFQSWRLPFARPTLLVLVWYQSRWARFADGWIVQTAVARQGLCDRLGIPQNSVAVVSNTCAHWYRRNQLVTTPPSPTEPLKILCFSASYPHKRLEMIPDVAQALERRMPHRDFSFLTTLPEDCRELRSIRERAKRIGIGSRIDNRGRIPVHEGASLYSACHVAFLPSVLETFSAVYPEAMAMGLPIVTSDLPFARDVCGTAASYFRPNDPGAAAAALARLVQDPVQWQQLTHAGKATLTRFPTPEEQYGLMCDLVEDFKSGMPLDRCATPVASARAA